MEAHKAQKEKSGSLKLTAQIRKFIPGESQRLTKPSWLLAWLAKVLWLLFGGDELNVVVKLCISFRYVY